MKPTPDRDTTGMRPSERSAADAGAPGPAAWRAAAAGIVAGAVAIGVSELLAGLVPGTPSLVLAVGNLVISLQPPGAKDLVTSLFGTGDKTALNAAVVAAALLVAALAGIIGRADFTRAWRILAGFGFLALVAALLQPSVSAPLAALNALVATAGAICALRPLLAEAGFSGSLQARPEAGVPPDPTRTSGPMPDWNRRRFLLRSVGLLGGALVAGGVGRLLLEQRHPAGAPPAATLPVSTEVVAPLTADESLAAPGITPLVTPTNRFYRIDTELLVPQVDASGWRLEVTGMVDRPFTLTYAELLALPLFEQYLTLECVSNPVGGDLIGNTLWTGVRLKQVLAEAGLQPGATQIVGRSVDGFTVGFPTAWALAPGREPMIAVGMNGAPLPAEHGYPARLIVPGLFGYVSATKWLAQIELTTQEAFDAYWVRLGWAKDGPILTGSRIDHPTDGSHLAAGPIEIDGLAWAPDRGVQKVEVRVDDGPWQPALLSRAISRATWVQWMVRWPATPGAHAIEVRATDGTGAVQTATPGGPAPAGATGYDRVQVTVA
jgi:DMSO/TMAO reductase YedYZ molybdopterin-dependent catalytic subunit